MIIVQVYTLIRGIGVEWARMLYGQMRVTGIGWDALFNGSDALNKVPAQILEALVQQGHEQKHVRHEWHESVSEISEQANNRKTESLVLARLSVHRKILKVLRMLVLCNGQFLNGRKVWPAAPSILGVISIISVVGYPCTPTCVIAIAPAFFGLGKFCFSGACDVLDVACWATFACGGCCWNGFPPLFLPLPFPFSPSMKAFLWKNPYLSFLSCPSCLFLFHRKLCLAGRSPMRHSLFPLTSDGSRVLTVCLSFHSPSVCLSSTIGRIIGAQSN